jgi:hypothetical protein
MGAGYFIIAILGCADSGEACRPVASPPTHYASEQACMAARGDALMANSDLNFPTLFAECRAIAPKASASQPDRLPDGASRA